MYFKIIKHQQTLLINNYYNIKSYNQNINRDLKETTIDYTPLKSLWYILVFNFFLVFG